MRRTVLTLMIGFLLGGGVVYGTTNPQPVDKVATFNDGWADSKQDDCEMGSQYACDWMGGK